MSEESEFDCGEDVLEQEDICDYNGEQCIGDRLFCEECSVFCDICDYNGEQCIGDRLFCEECSVFCQASSILTTRERKGKTE